MWRLQVDIHFLYCFSLTKKSVCTCMCCMCICIHTDMHNCVSVCATYAQVSAWSSVSSSIWQFGSAILWVLIKLRPSLGSLLSPKFQFLRQVISLTHMPTMFDLLCWALLIHLELQASKLQDHPVSTAPKLVFQGARGFWSQVLKL